MEINVAQLLKLPLGTTRAYEVDEDVLGLDESKGPSRVRGNVKMLRTKDGILVTAALNTEVECTCSRCLETTRCSLHLTLEEEYYPVVDVNTGYPLDVPEGSSGFTISPNHVLSLDEGVRQYVLLNGPMQPLCQPDCAGLCPECGANLNYDKCDCHLQAEDNPFGVLRSLLNTGDEGDSLSASNERS